jgi:hypothetical protein
MGVSGPSGRIVADRLIEQVHDVYSVHWVHSVHLAAATALTLPDRRAPGTGVVDANVRLALAFSDRGRYRARGLETSGSTRLPIDRFLESDPPGLVSMCRTGPRLES